MDLLRDTFQYVLDNPDRFREALRVHIRLSLTSLAFALLIFFPIGVFVSRSRRIGPALVAAITAARVVPSLAILFLLFPYTGTGFETALIALTALAGPPLVINTDAGLRNVDPAVLENARGLGMNPLQVFGCVQLPLALPVVIAGVRTATVEIIASATLAALIGAGGLGQFITSGVATNRYPLLLVGAIPVAILALLAEAMLGAAERFVTPPAA